MIIGTRGSELALKQTDIFIKLATIADPSMEFEVKIIKSSGDIDLKTPMSQMGGYGAFVRELDDALLDGRIDISVNSMKDMPIEPTPGLAVPSVLARASIEDVITPCGLDNLAQGAVVGTSSIRREAAIKELRPDLEVKSIRGNVQTRLRKLEEGDYDAIILAKAGIDRLGLQIRATVLDPEIFIPAPAQGAIAMSCRADDKKALGILAKVNHRDTMDEVTAERVLMRMMGAGCSSPIGINARKEGDKLTIRAVSFEYSEKPIRIKKTVPLEYTICDMERIASVLRGGSP